MNPSNRYKDYLHATGNFVVDITKMDNGRYKASCNGYEANHLDQAEAVRELQQTLHEKLLTGELTPGA